VRQQLRRMAVRLRKARGDRGVASVEFATLALVILALTFIAIQAGYYFHARKVAQSAARHGVEAGRAFGATPSDGADQARDFLARYGNSVQSAHVSTAGTTPREIRITVTGTVATLVPGLEFDVNQSVQAPIERWTAP
jgi:Flp pilus assembly protein TadG